MGALIAGIAVSTLVSAISGYMGSKAQAEAYETLANASDEEKAEFKKAYDESFGEGSYNASMQKLGAQAQQQYYDLLNNEESWDRYINGSEAYVAPETFSFSADDLYNDPSYELRMDEARKALSQKLASQGYAGSGYAAKEMNDYIQNQASKEYSNAYNRAYQQYTDDRTFDYNAWKNEANQYYQNLTNQLAGLNNVSTQGAQASTAQANALNALAGNNASAIQQNATSNAASSQANTAAYQSILDALAKGSLYAGGAVASQSGATANPSNTSSASSTATNTTSTDSGWDTLDWNTAMTPTTSNIVGA